MVALQKVSPHMFKFSAATDVQFLQTISHLNGATERLSVELSSHARQAAETREMHLAASASLTDLAGAIQQLTTFTQGEMKALNATAVKIRNELSLGIGTDWLDWWTGWVVKVLRASGQCEYCAWRAWAIKLTGGE